MKTVIFSTLVQGDARPSVRGFCGNEKVPWPKIMQVSICVLLNYEFTDWELVCASADSLHSDRSLASTARPPSSRKFGLCTTNHVNTPKQPLNRTPLIVDGSNQLTVVVDATRSRQQEVSPRTAC